jgi:hypothetical protein
MKLTLQEVLKNGMNRFVKFANDKRPLKEILAEKTQIPEENHEEEEYCYFSIKEAVEDLRWHIVKLNLGSEFERRRLHNHGG